MVTNKTIKDVNLFSNIELLYSKKVSKKGRKKYIKYN